MVSFLRFVMLMLLTAGLWLPFAREYGWISERADIKQVAAENVATRIVDDTAAEAERGIIGDKSPAPQKTAVHGKTAAPLKSVDGEPPAGDEKSGAQDKTPAQKADPAPQSQAMIVPKVGVPPKTATPDAELKRMIGQMLMMGFRGQRPEDRGAKAAQALLAAGDIGGLIFMGENLKDKAQVSELIAFMRAARPKAGVPFLGIDQEGGMVQRLQGRHGFTPIPTAEMVAAEKSPEKVTEIYTTLARELREVGFNMNFGPVVDLNLVPTNPIIGDKARSYGAEPEDVARFAKAFVMAHRRMNMLTALKHFPGHGSSWTDSHEQFVDLSKSWQKQELTPYRALIKRGLADMVMVGHLYHPDFSDEGQRPASLSRTAIEKRLRGEIGFRGLVVTDDLGMGAVKKYYPFTEALIHAVNAGNDILLIAAGHYARPADVKLIHETLMVAVQSGRIKRETIRASYWRILAAKKRLKAGEAAAKRRGERKEGL